MKNGKLTLLEFIDNDPTLSFFINSKIDYNKFDWQLRVKLEAFRIAYYQWLEYIFK